MSDYTFTLPWEEKILQAFMHQGEAEFPSLESMAGGGGFVLFLREGQNFKIQGTSKKGVRNISFLKEESESWMSVFENGFFMLPPEMSEEGFRIWLAVDRLNHPDYLVVLEAPAEDCGEKAFGSLLRFALAHDLFFQPGKMRFSLPSWLEKKMHEMEAMNSPVLLLSESGSGSEELLQAFVSRKFIHKPSVCIFSPGRLSEAVQLRELFGDPAGVRLGDGNGIISILERNPSCIVVKEAGFLSMEVQKRIVNILERNRSIFWIFESTMNLKGMAEEGYFFQALYEKLLPGEILLPPLRACRSYLINEARNIISEFSRRNGRKVTLHASAEEAILSYEWEGNWEQFKSTLESSCLMCKDGQLTGKNLKIFQSQEQEDWGDLNLRRRSEELERSLILKAYSLHGGNQVHMSRSLGISRGSLQYKMHKYNLNE